MPDPVGVADVSVTPDELDKLRDEYKVAADKLTSASKSLLQSEVVSTWVLRWGSDPSATATASDPGPPYYLILSTPIIELPAQDFAAVPIEVLRRYLELRVSLDDWHLRGGSWPISKA